MYVCIQSLKTTQPLFILFFALFILCFTELSYDYFLLKVIRSAVHMVFAKYFYNEYLTNDGHTLLYRILYPVNYNPKIKYPLFLVLHGAGEKGNDNVAQLTHGSYVFLNEINRESHPAIVIFPQCPSDSFWASITEKDRYAFDFKYSDKLNWPTQAAVDLVKSFVKDKNADKERLYITGISMGGMGAMEIISRNPDMFIAAAIICGGADLTYVDKYVKKVNFWIFHGDSDPTVPVEYSRKLTAALRAGGGNVKYSEYPGVKHESWDRAFAEFDFYSWFFNFRKKYDNSQRGRTHINRPS